MAFTYGDRNMKKILLIHGMGTSAKVCYGPLIPYLSDYFVIMWEVDGHSDTEKGDFVSVSDACDRIEKYVFENFDGSLYAVSGFSLGGTLAVELLARGNIRIEKVFLDAPFIAGFGIFSDFVAKGFVKQIERLKSGKQPVGLLRDMAMGKDNNAPIEMFYDNVSNETIMNVCLSLFSYEVPEKLKERNIPVMMIYGSFETFPKKSAVILKGYIPQLRVVVIPGLGHGQFIYYHTQEYAKMLCDFLAEDDKEKENTSI
ncbi:MAG: alpha/beta hydrolase [Clostridia bacterium]|nr:alpha/beta hydrolase [Clostridia bacterium]